MTRLAARLAMATILALAAAMAMPSTAGAAERSSAAGKPGVVTYQTDLEVTKQYLLLPISNRGRGAAVSLTVDGREVRFLGATLADAADQSDWWAFLHIAEYNGKTATLEVSGRGLTEETFKLIRQDNHVPGEEKWGTEPKRPQFHFSQKVGWNNDPNGLVYYDGEWHLFFQHNPVGIKWGNMTWGHAVSRDLVHWTQLPNALHHKRGDGMWSGGAAVDWKNTGGWKTGENDVLIATWTSIGRDDCVAYSNDRGRTFTEYEGNPVILHPGRDPKPRWYAYGKGDKPLNDAAAKLGGHWGVAVYHQKGGKGGPKGIGFYTSTDLKDWTEQSLLPGYHECPELIKLPVDGDPENTRWVVFGGGALYALGDFDGRTFTPAHEGNYQLHYGGYYASQCFSDAPDDRCVQIGWATGLDFKGMPFNQTFSFPTELTLRTTPDGVRMFGEPVKEIETVHGKAHKATNQKLADGRSVKLDTEGALFDIRAQWQVGTAKQIGLDIDGRKAFVYDVAEATIKDLVQAKPKDTACQPVDGRISVQILIDRPMMETFVNHGAMIFNHPYQNDLDIESVQAWARGGEAKLETLEVYELNASWKRGANANNP